MHEDDDISLRQSEAKSGKDWAAIWLAVDRVDALWRVFGPVVQIVRSYKLVLGILLALVSFNFDKLARFADALKELLL
jgi:hypothetical protein